MSLRFLTGLAELETEAAAAFSLPADLRVAEIVQPDILDCPPETPLHAAAAAMQARRCSSILVMEDGKPVGIWTERDALSVDFTDPAQFTQPIRAVMSSPVLTISGDTPLRSVAALFKRDGLRHYLVVDESQQVLGILSQTDVVEHQGIEHYLHMRTVGSVVRRDVPRLAATASLTDAIDSMRQRATAAILVAFPDGSHGILTERDLVRLIVERSGERPLGELASWPLLTVPPDLSLYRARELLSKNQVRHIGVQDGSTLLGLVSFAEIMSDIEVSYVRDLQRALEIRDRALSASRRSLHLAERIIESTLEGVIITDANARIVSVNPAFTKMTGYTAEEAIGKTPAMLSSGRHSKEFYQELWRQLREHGNWQGEIWNRRKNGEVYPEYLSITAIKDEQGNITHYAGMFNDITKLKENEENIRNLAYRDPLTGLPNRRLLDDRLEMAIAHAHRHGTRVGVLFIDLDRFKQVNDSLGHAAGDELLVKIARRLERGVREDDTVARLGGDEFVVVLTDVEHYEDVRETAERLLEAIRQPLQFQGRQLVITCSLGMSVYPDDGLDRETLLKQADAAMYQIKDSGRDGLSVYLPPADPRREDRFTLRLELREALEQGKLELYYQPLMDGTGRLAGAEALLRWDHPKLGAVSPELFISLAEDSGLIVLIGELALQKAAEQLAQWHAQGLLLPEISVNVSARQLRDRNFSAHVKDILERTGVAPERLTLELTESVLMDEVASAKLRTLKTLGVGLALDDFGTGYSALAYLKRFPIDRLKIDRGFIKGILSDPADAAIVSTLIDLGRKLDLQVVAEGVETEQQLEALRASGCHYFQGYVYAPALPADKFTARFLDTEVAAS